MRDDADPTAAIGSAVRSFYDDLPFNHWGSVRAAADAIRTNVIRDTYPDLHALLGSGEVRSVAEFGCGAGWLACSLARHYGLAVTALDFSAKALQRAQALAVEVRVADRVTFVCRNLFDELPVSDVDLVISLGVLHHTGDARRAFGHVQRAACAGGHVHVGLYHRHGRQVFLEMFRELVASRGEAAAFERFRALTAGRGSDEEHLQSWFRDQVLHPHETQHTLREVVGWLDEDGLELRSTSINRFERIDGRDALFEMEVGYAERSRQANVVEGRFFPGFFTFLAQRAKR
ncbi:MAG TPA: class I SAM-dependent methyltransferase [Planctomycetota bacterium]|nr:class I SAM-dependent methyltransferase [Planctomycetota bacterium]